jgi:hypothetical protein
MAGGKQNDIRLEKFQPPLSKCVLSPIPTLPYNFFYRLLPYRLFLKIIAADLPLVLIGLEFLCR